MSPGRYQKRFRLQEARRLLMCGDANASDAASRAGYASPSQFSREYARMFGQSADAGHQEVTVIAVREARRPARSAADRTAA